jgi:lysine 2,3-aminomutase
MSRTLRTADALLDAGLLPPGRAEAARAVAARYAIAVTPHVAALIDHAGDPVGLQYLPDAAELLTLPHETADPTADAPFSPVPGIVHRYPDRALLKPLLACPVYCRFCFRREHVGPDGGLLDDAALDAALAWFARTPAVREAILTGGDPLMLSPRRLARILDALEAVPHLELLRIHTRVPVADPSLVTDALAAVLARAKPLTICVHANHAREFGGDAPAALRRLHAAGVSLLGQSVLLAGVNDSAAALEDLVRTMLRNRVKPYYLHQLDPAPGTARFHVPPETGLALIAGLRGRVPGHAIPHYVVERPGGAGKAPVTG